MVNVSTFQQNNLVPAADDLTMQPFISSEATDSPSYDEAFCYQRKQEKPWVLNRRRLIAAHTTGFIGAYFVSKLLVFSSFLCFISTLLAWAVFQFLFRFLLDCDPTKTGKLAHHCGLDRWTQLLESTPSRSNMITSPCSTMAAKWKTHEVEKELPLAGLLCHLGLYWRTSYFISDHLRLKNLFRTMWTVCR